MSCAITTAMDGSEDDKIHCFKPDQPCAAGRVLSLLAEQTAHAQEAVDSDDPFPSDEDDDENGNNEATIEYNEFDTAGVCYSFDEDEIQYITVLDRVIVITVRNLISC